MNALPLKSGLSLQTDIERVIAEHGLRRVLLVLAARLIRRSRPPDRTRKKMPGSEVIPGYLRKDLGLPPEAPPRILVDLRYLQKEFYR